MKIKVMALERLAQLDYDAALLYEAAMDHITELKVKETLGNFKKDHERHVKDLNRLIAGLGGKVVERKRDVMGLVLETFTNVRSLTGTGGALNAMDTNEMLTNAAYRAALGLEFAPEAREILEKNYEDEKRHKAFIEKELSGRSLLSIFKKAA